MELTDKVHGVVAEVSGTLKRAKTDLHAQKRTSRNAGSVGWSKLYQGQGGICMDPHANPCGFHLGFSLAEQRGSSRGELPVHH